MPKVPVFISFDFDHDQDLKVLLVGQALNEDSPFSIVDFSVKEPLTGDWKAKVRTRIRRADVVIVICGHDTRTATGVDTELRISQEEGKPYFFLCGRADNRYQTPSSARVTDKVYDWTWPNLKLLIAGNR